MALESKSRFPGRTLGTIVQHPTHPLALLQGDGTMEPHGVIHDVLGDKEAAVH